MEKMKTIMEQFRKTQPSSFGGIAIKQIKDLHTSKCWNTANPEKKETVDLPESDVILWYLEEGTVIIVRPSGTEPKIKFYILARTELGSEGLAAARDKSKTKLDAMIADIKKYLE
jgi:phosphoglucomutase